jgi:hypothetical protein
MEFMLGLHIFYDSYISYWRKKNYLGSLTLFELRRAVHNWSLGFRMWPLLKWMKINVYIKF